MKPGNVLIAGQAPLHVYLTDFGLTKKAGSQSGITKTGLFVGTIDYAAPEQIKGWPVDARADVYALGCVLFEMLAGAPPFRRENEYATMYAHTSEPPPALSGVAPGLPPALDGVIIRALAKEPDGRYPSAGDLARAAEAAIAGQTIVAPERTVAIGRAAPATAVQGHPVYEYGIDPATVALPSPRRQWIPYALIALVLAIAGAVAVVVSGSDSRPNAAPAVQRGPTVNNGVVQIAFILDLSQQGRTLTADGQYSKAIANRQQVLDKLNALNLAPQLETSRTLLRQAAEASIGADQALLECETCASTQAANKKATTLKQQFVAQFNPYATRYLHRSFDPASF